MATFVDSHTHLADPAFDGDRDEVIARARLSGAAAIVCIGESLAAADRAAGIAKANPGFVFHTAGVHPHDAAAFDEAGDVPRIRAHIAGGARAIGECGLDYHYDHSPREAQRRAFAAQLALAQETGRPVVVHTRDAVPDTTAMVAEAGRAGIGGVLHCFTGPASLAATALDAGWYLSFSGIVTFRSWNEDALLTMVPENKLLVESDAPYLAPIPHRGKRNEPAFVTLTLARLAAARGVTAALLGERTIENAARFFGLELTVRAA